jgi:hypothetical protein
MDSAACSRRSVSGRCTFARWSTCWTRRRRPADSQRFYWFSVPIRHWKSTTLRQAAVRHLCRWPDRGVAFCSHTRPSPPSSPGSSAWFDMLDAASYVEAGGFITSLTNKASGVAWTTVPHGPPGAQRGNHTPTTTRTRSARIESPLLGRIEVPLPKRARYVGHTVAVLVLAGGRRRRLGGTTVTVHPSGRNLTR